MVPQRRQEGDVLRGGGVGVGEGEAPAPSCPFYMGGRWRDRQTRCHLVILRPADPNGSCTTSTVARCHTPVGPRPHNSPAAEHRGSECGLWRRAPGTNSLALSACCVPSVSSALTRGQKLHLSKGFSEM